MSVSVEEKSRRRRILYSSLDKGTPAEVVQLAIDLLDNEFGAQSDMKYSALIKRLQEISNHDAFRSANLLGRIMMVRNKPVEVIGPDPSDQNAGSNSGSAAPKTQPQVVLKGRDLVFNTLLKNITAAVAKQKQGSEESYRENFVKNALHLDLGRNCATKLVSWAKSNAEMSSIVGSDKDLQKIVNTAFVWLCQKFGPVAADKILLHAVSQTEQLPEAFDDSLHTRRQHLWTFTRVEGIEPTNNPAERALRPAVIYRKLSFGTQSESGSRYLERILTVSEACRPQGRNAYQFLIEAMEASFASLPAPSLVPKQDDSQNETIAA